MKARCEALRAGQDPFAPDCLLAVLDGMPAGSAAELRTRLTDLRACAARLFARTNEPLSVDAELEIRFGFFDAWLK